MIFHSTISLPPQKIPLSKFLMTSLHVICGLGLPNQKSLLRIYSKRQFFAEKLQKSPGDWGFAPKPFCFWLVVDPHQDPVCDTIELY